MPCTLSLLGLNELWLPLLLPLPIMLSAHSDVLLVLYSVFKVRTSGCSFRNFRRKPSSGLPNGDEGIRTPDPLLARQVLSQLSYTPMDCNCPMVSK